MSKLLPCPFCGSSDVKIYYNEYGCRESRYDGYVECNTCDAVGPRIDTPAIEVVDGKHVVRSDSDIKELIVNKWNHRVSIITEILNFMENK